MNHTSLFCCLDAPDARHVRARTSIPVRLTRSDVLHTMQSHIHIVNIHILNMDGLVFKESYVSAQPVLLGFLTLGPRHPYELHQEFDRELGGVWHIGLSHLYAYLKQLAEAGLVTVETEAQPNRPSRNVYQITPAGQETFLTWLHRPTQHVRHIRLEFLARLYFFRRLAVPGLEQLVTDQKALLQSRVESLGHAIAETEEEYWRLVLEFRQSEMETIIRWLDRCLQTK